ncbi:ANTAR domain-containing protein [Streptomyces microflavus]|uniref:ANTAR domain-containing protein n=1 Tax=Streptomyces microflavus TaxID=1919 RepID=UPI0038195A47
MIIGSINAHCPSDKSLRYGSLITPRISTWTCPSSGPDRDQCHDRAITNEEKSDLTTTQDIQLAQALADLATISILQQRTLPASELERGQLQYALTTGRIVLEQVKGILAERWQLSVDEAFTAFRTYARSHHHQLTRLAQQITDGQFDTDQIPHPTVPLEALRGRSQPMLNSGMACSVVVFGSYQEMGSPLVRR